MPSEIELLERQQEAQERAQQAQEAESRLAERQDVNAQAAGAQAEVQQASDAQKVKLEAQQMADKQYTPAQEADARLAADQQQSDLGGLEGLEVPGQGIYRTTHGKDSPEHLPNIEREPQTVFDETKKPKPPEGWTPGGIEKGY